MSTTIVTAEDRKPSIGEFRVVSRTYAADDLVIGVHRGAVLRPGMFVAGSWETTDVSEYPTAVQQAAAELWTPEAIAACQAAFPWVEPPPPIDPPLRLVDIASARLAIDGFDITSIDRTKGLSVAFVADADTVWIFFDEPQLDTEYLVTPPEGVTKYADYIEVTKPGLAAVSLIVQRIT